MTKFVRNSRLRRAISLIAAVAMVATIVVMPAGALAAPPYPTTVVGTPTFGSSFTTVEATCATGLQGIVSVQTSGTPSLNAAQESTATYQTDGAKASILGGTGPTSLGVTQTVGDFSLKIATYSGTGGVPSNTTTIPVSLDTTVGGVVAAINAVMNGLPADQAVDAYFTTTGRIRLVKRLVENNSEVWAYSGPDPLDPSTSPLGLGVAQAVFGGNNAFGRGSGPANSYRLGVDNTSTYSSITTFTPNAGVGYEVLPKGVFGSWIDGVKAKGFQSSVDTMTGQYTAFELASAPYTIDLGTGARGSAVIAGTTTFALGHGARLPQYSCPTMVSSGDATAGVVTTWTVAVPAPSSPSLANAYNGVSVLIPAGFTLVNVPGGFNASLGATPTIETSATSEGQLVTLGGFVQTGNISFQVALAATQTAGEYGPAKIWIHNVGTPWTADPAVNALIDSSFPDAKTDWVPTFCTCTPPSLTVVPGLLSKLTVSADKNRAKGYTPLTAVGYDAFGNMLDPSVGPGQQFTVAAPVLSGVTDEAKTSAGDPGEWIWKLAKTEGINTATIKAIDTRSDAASATGSVNIDTTGVGEPDHVVVLPTATSYPNGGSPSFQIELRDANNNPTSWLDSHNIATDWFEVSAHSENNAFPVPGGLANTNRFIHRGWSRSTFSSSSLSTIWTTDADGGTSWSAWPTTFGFGMSAIGPDTWTIGAKHESGSVRAAELVTVDIASPGMAAHGVPVGIKVSAVATAPAQYADRDTIYNNKGDAYADDAFGVAAADGTSTVVLTARVVDAYGDTVTQNTGNVAVKFEIPKFYKDNAIFATGHVYNTTTDANGIATVSVKSFEPTLARRFVPGWGWSWFTPIKASFATINVPGASWASPCGSTQNYRDGYGFVYFHGAKMTAELAQTLEGDGNKDVILADGSDNVTYTATVTDSAFNTPIPNWDVKFTTSLGTFADGSAAANLKTDAAGMAAVVLKSPTAGEAYVRAYDRYVGSLNPYRSSFVESVLFTDYATKYTVDEPTKTAGDRATAKVTAWAENIKTGEKVQFDNYGVGSWSGDVYANDAANMFGEGVNAPIYTNDIQNVDLGAKNAAGHYDSVTFKIPAFDDEHDAEGPRFESAGGRYAVIGGSFNVSTWVGNVFYNANSIVAAPARPAVDFIKEATLKAEGTQLSNSMSLTGAGFTPGLTPPGYTDSVDVYLGDITAGNATSLGEGYVGRDGVLLPSATTEYINRLSPGLYDITVDGLVFKNGLEIKNLYNEAWLQIDNKRSGTRYLDGHKDHHVQVHAYGAKSFEVWAGALKIANSDANGDLIMKAGSILPGPHTLRALIKWDVTDALTASPYKADGIVLGQRQYTTMVALKFYIQESLKFRSTTLSSSGHTLKASGKVSGPSEDFGTTTFSLKVTIQKFTGGHWKTYKVKTVTASGGKYLVSFANAGAGKYRAVVSHSDMAHPASSSTSNSRTIN
jgi:hypothetical protein